ncbi:histone deacetylase 11 [Gracilinanus agilis]|uniref:histone deacetylase 11 n=1 Tax=Gracilinanus agilis TaxID=191870 RepID=UPI001CFC95CD|nr:histone deacetylase 11 [Gracilinanus agilis]
MGTFDVPTPKNRKLETHWNHGNCSLWLLPVTAEAGCNLFAACFQFVYADFPYQVLQRPRGGRGVSLSPGQGDVRGRVPHGTPPSLGPSRLPLAQCKVQPQTAGDRSAAGPAGGSLGLRRARPQWMFPPPRGPQRLRRVGPPRGQTAGPGVGGHQEEAGPRYIKAVVYLMVSEDNFLSDLMIVEPEEASEEDLKVVHTEQYLRKLKCSFIVATIIEILPVALIPNFLVQRKVLRPLRFQTGGTILAGKLAIENGWAINIGGGFHHCSANKGGGFCVYADITLCIKFLFERVAGISRVTIIDLDAHQGNGHERDFMDDSRVYIMDVYNHHIYPYDSFAKRAIKQMVELDWKTEDEEYLEKVQMHMERALDEWTPHLVIYNAGTDIMKGDPLGGLSVSPKGIVMRDELVFRTVRKYGVPILMVTSGGYQKKTARVIADSILNLYNMGLIRLNHFDFVKNGSSRRPSLASLSEYIFSYKQKHHATVTPDWYEDFQQFNKYGAGALEN